MKKRKDSESKRKREHTYTPNERNKKDRDTVKESRSPPAKATTRSVAAAVSDPLANDSSARHQILAFVSNTSTRVLGCAVLPMNPPATIHSIGTKRRHKEMTRRS